MTETCASPQDPGPSCLVASLPMYDLPELREATDGLWRAIAGRLAERGLRAPAALTRDEAPLELVWSSPRLLLSQTCGYPLVTRLRNEVVVVGTPSYDAVGCEGPAHRSVVIVPAASRASSLADLRGRRCAVNDFASNTGMNLLRAEVAGLAAGRRFFGEVIETGAHVRSVESVAAGRADVAAIDPVTYALLRRFRPALTRGVRVLCWTAASAGLPLITSSRWKARMRGVLRDVLVEVSRDPALRDVRRELLWDGFVPLGAADYRPVLRFARTAADAGYPELR